MIEKLGITPGPWIIDDGNEVYSITENNIPITIVERFTGSQAERNNNMLIAAAPEMLELIIEEALNYDVTDRTINIIEKATGRTWEEVKQLLAARPEEDK